MIEYFDAANFNTIVVERDGEVLDSRPVPLPPEVEWVWVHSSAGRYRKAVHRRFTVQTRPPDA